MILIDRDAAIKAMCEACPRYGHCLISCVCKKTLEEFPRAVGVQEVVETNWYKSGLDYFSCGHCKTLSKIRSEYCPRCGAKMKKEVKTWQ